MGERHFYLSSIADVEKTTQNPRTVQVIGVTEIPYGSSITTFKAGNLTQFLSWTYSEDGPNHQRMHYASVKCESVFQPDLEPVLSHAVKGRVIGSGEGSAKTLAKQGAAVQALSTIQNGDIEGLLP